MYVAVALLAAACSGGDEGERVSIEQLTDLDAELPEDASGIELGQLTPPDDLAFCEAAGTAPARWLTDALVPIQYWVDAFSAVGDAPPAARESIDALVDFGERRLRWHFGRIEERPEWTADLAAEAVALFDVALDECDDLPLVVGLPGTSDRPSGWAGLGDDEIAARCADFVARVAEGAAWFVAETGRRPRHQQEIELANGLAWQTAIEATGEFPDDVTIYVSSDWIGIGSAGDPTQVPGGACDLR